MKNLQSFGIIEYQPWKHLFSEFFSAETETLEKEEVAPKNPENNKYDERNNEGLENEAAGLAKFKEISSLSPEERKSLAYSEVLKSVSSILPKSPRELPEFKKRLDALVSESSYNLSSFDKNKKIYLDGNELSLSEIVKYSSKNLKNKESAIKFLENNDQITYSRLKGLKILKTILEKNPNLFKNKKSLNLFYSNLFKKNKEGHIIDINYPYLDKLGLNGDVLKKKYINNDIIFNNYAETHAALQLQVASGKITSEEAQRTFKAEMKEDPEALFFYSELEKESQTYTVTAEADRIFSTQNFAKNSDNKKFASEEAVKSAVSITQNSGLNIQNINSVRMNEGGNVIFRLRPVRTIRGTIIPMEVAVNKEGKSFMKTPFFDKWQEFNSPEELQNVMKLAEYNAVISQILKEKGGVDKESFDEHVKDTDLLKIIKSYEKIVTKNRLKVWEEVFGKIVNQLADEGSFELYMRKLAKKPDSLRRKELASYTSVTNKEQDARAEGAGNEQHEG